MKTKLFLCCFLLTVAVAAQAQFSGSGAGTSSDPYIITTAKQLDEVRNDMSYSTHYKLANDIDLTGYLAQGGGGYAQWGEAGWNPLGVFSDRTTFFGNFNGAGYKITGLWINRPDEQHVGFFGYTSLSTIDSLGIEIAAAGIKGGAGNTGGLVGTQASFGQNISNCYVTGSVSGIGTVGGLVGSHSGNTNNCCVVGSISGRTAGGLMGMIGSFSNISNCYTIVNVTGNFAGGNQIGGLGGRIPVGGNLSNCYVIGNIGNNDYNSNAGGLTSEVTGVYMDNCYVAASVNGTFNVGALVGNSSSLRINNCFFDTETTGQTEALGTGGVAWGTELGATGVTTAEMRAGDTFKGANWDFDTVWGIYENYGYPYLKKFNNDILIAPEGGGKTYDGQPAPMPAPYDVVSDNPEVDVAAAKALLTGELAYSKDGMAPAVSVKNIGTYNIEQYTLNSPYYQISFKHDETYDITTQRQLTIAGLIINKVKEYDGNTSAIAAAIPSGVFSGDRVSVTVDAHYDTKEVGTGKTITVAYSLSGDDAVNYIVPEDDVLTDGAITVRVITVTADAKTKAYGELDDPALTYTYDPELVDDDELTGEITRAMGENAGAYDILPGTLGVVEQDLTASSNYSIVFVGEELFTILPRGLTITADTKTKTYGERDPALTYTYEPALVDGDELTGELTRVTGENADIYDILPGTLGVVRQGLTASSNYSIVFVGEELFTISQRQLTIKAVDEEIHEGETPKLAYAIEGSLVDGDELTGALSVGANNDSPLQAGMSYAITQGTLTAGDNYAILFVEGILTVLDNNVDIGKILADKQTLMAYPNPTRGQLIINSSTSLTNLNEQLIINSIQVFDLNGKLVLQPNTNSFDISHLPNGVYMVKVNGEVIKVVKK